jgi:diaminohydroxyphosphoribosylaminopyrimidine deaminase / 5-amino-6-(5-phosphoribosylamino)uracil reductase
MTRIESQWTDMDRQAMSRAFALAQRGLYTTDPNPRVGCVLLRDGEQVGEGWHETAGEPHAEANALKSAGSAARGATAYVTLEPCNHHGRTPPCSQALIDAGISRVVYALDDPNPLVAGQGAARLRAHAVRVDAGLMAAASEALNPGYLRRMRGGRPFVRVKLAMSLDGHTALATGESRWITSAAARNDAQLFRARSSAILTGVGTILADDPALNARIDASDRQPLRVVLDSHLRTPSDSRVIHRKGGVLILAVEDHAARRDSLQRQRAEVELVAARDGRPDLPAVLEMLAGRGMNEIWVEAGATLAGAFVKEQLYDELIVYVAPALLGSGARGLLDLPELQTLEQKLTLRFTDCRMVGDDLRLTATPG